MKCAIVYLSMTGNTETIAMGVRDGILSVTGNCDMIKFRDASPYEFGKYDLIAFGTIVMGYKDPDVFGSFIKSLRYVGGKHAIAFATHGTHGEYFPAHIAQELVERQMKVLGVRRWYANSYIPGHANPYPCLLYTSLSHKEALKEAIDLLGLVGIPNPEQRIKDYPYQFSGGMQQRIMIAMAMSCSPAVLIADEPTTALDVTVQAQLLEVLNGLRRQYGTALVIITHNLGVVARYAEKVQVVYAGRLVEGGTAEDIFQRTCHPYTKGLIRAVPRLDMPQDQELVGIEGSPPDLRKLSPHLCAFSDRCRYATAQCRSQRPELEEVAPGHVAACFHARELRKEVSPR